MISIFKNRKKSDIIGIKIIYEKYVENPRFSFLQGSTELDAAIIVNNNIGKHVI